MQYGLLRQDGVNSKTTSGNVLTIHRICLSQNLSICNDMPHAWAEEKLPRKTA